jgi:hypothetical protein
VSGLRAAASMRKRPLPMPISSSTGRSDPNTRGQSNTGSRSSGRSRSTNRLSTGSGMASFNGREMGRQPPWPTSERIRRKTQMRSTPRGDPLVADDIMRCPSGVRTAACLTCQKIPLASSRGMGSLLGPCSSAQHTDQVAAISGKSARVEDRESFNMDDLHVQHLAGSAGARSIA